MTAGDLARATITEASRRLSQEIFGRPHQLEVAAAVGELHDGFVIEALLKKAEVRAIAAGLAPPKQSAIRKNLERLVKAGAVRSLPSPRPGSPGYYSAAGDSAFWGFASQLYERG
jgi:hypothetical protein